MLYLAVAALAALLLYAVRKRLLAANPAMLARNIRRAGGWLGLGLAALLALRGQLQAALMLGIAAATLLLQGAGSLFGGRSPSPGQRSQVRTSLLEMTLDLDTGEMQGVVLAGPMAGRSLESLSREEVLALLTACRASDAQSAALLEAYLDRRFPDWREVASGGSGTGGARMSRAEAAQVLGVAMDADADTVRAAWRALMKRNHPDQGGSTYLAAKINEAKDVLLGEGDV